MNKPTVIEKDMKIYKDKVLDTCWITLKKDIEDYSEEIAPGFSLEFNKKGEVIGIEIQNFSRLSEFKPLSSSATSISEHKIESIE